MINQIITPTEFSEFRNISKKLDISKINEAIKLAQQSDLIDILGDFYFDVVKNQNEPEYSDLMDGSEFEYCGDAYEHQGIKALLADYTYARFVYTGNITPTPFGFQKKKTDDSEGIDRNTAKDLAKQAQIDAGIKFKFIQKYILSEPELFSRYCSGKKGNTEFFTQKISRL